jgi:DNA repair exonuclease SbcCD ATPase subunit
MPDMGPGIDPLRAVELWMKEDPPASVKRNAVLALFEHYLSALPDNAFDRVAPKPFIVLHIGGTNFGPYRSDQSVELTKGIWAVTGRYEGTSGRSNRAGKSALMLMLRQALYGDVLKGKDQEKLIYGGEDRMRAACELEVNNVELVTMERALKRGSNQKLKINGDSFKQVDGVARWMDLVGLERDDFVRTCFVQEGDLHGVLGRSNAQIHQDMSRWMGLRGWEMMHKAVDADIAELRREFDAARVKVESLREAMEEAKEKFVGKLERQREVVEELELRRKGDKERRVEIRDVEARIEKAERIMNSLTIVANETIWRNKLRENVIKRDKASKEADGVREVLGALRSEMYKVKNNLRGFDGECPVDGRGCPRTDDINSDDRAQRAKLDDLVRVRKVQEKKLLGATARCDAATDDADEATEELRVVGDAREVLEEHGEKHEALAKLRRKLDLLSGEGEIGGNLDAEKDVLLEMMAAERRHDSALKEAARQDKRLEVLSKEMASLMYFRHMVGRGGIPSMQIENAAGTIEESANRVLEMMGADHRLEFTFEEELKTVKEATCPVCGREFEKNERSCACGRKRGRARRDMFAPMVREGARLQTFDMDSSGGKSMLAFAVRVALARFLGVVFLALDEVDKSLDRVNLEAFVAMLPRLMEMGFKQVLVISHREHVRDSIDRRVEAVRHAGEGWSELKVP